MVKKSLTKHPSVLQLPATKAPKAFKFSALKRYWKLAGSVIIGLVVCTVAIYAAMRYNRPSTDDFAVVPNAGTTGLDSKAAAVRTVDEPWIRPAPEQPVAEPVEPGVTVPVISGNLSAPGTPAVTQTQAPATVPDVAKKHQETKSAEVKQGEKKPGQPEAVILDMEPAAAVKAKEVPGVQINAAKQPAKEMPKRSGGTGLVAVTPDGKTALFTNTATRLPEKFGVGDKLPSGEVIKSIDASGGVVKTDAREYRLE